MGGSRDDCYTHNTPIFNAIRESGDAMIGIFLLGRKVHNEFFVTNCQEGSTEQVSLPQPIEVLFAKIDAPCANDA